MALAAGTGVAFFEGAHAWATGWFARYNRGFTDRLDLGLDVATAVHSSDGTLTGKLQGRYQLRPRLRLEAAIGAADDSDGKSLTADAGLTLGTDRGSPWDFYTSLRAGAAKGYGEDVLFGPGEEPPPADALFSSLVGGAQGDIGSQGQFIFEGSFGYIFPEQRQEAFFFYLAAGLRFHIGR